MVRIWKQGRDLYFGKRDTILSGTNNDPVNI